MPLDLNIDLLSVGIAVAAALTIGFAVFFQKPKSLTNVFFLTFTAVNACWSILNYIVYRINEPESVLWVTRFVLFFAVFQSLSFYYLIWSFPDDKKRMGIVQKLLLPIGAIVGLLTLSPWVYSSVLVKVDEVPVPEAHGGIVLFGLFAVSMVVAGVTLLVRKVVRGNAVQRNQLKYLLIGTLLLFGLIIFFNFLQPTLFRNTRYIPLSAVFTLPFVIFSAYSIFRHQLFSIKVFSTQALTFLLSLGVLVEVIVADTPLILAFRLFIFLLVLSGGILLVKTVTKEVKQREELQVLTKELEAANKQLKDLDKARADFISIASHQLRTPPATIKWYVAAIISGDFGELLPDVKEQLVKVQATNNAQISLIDDMLNASRIERGKMEFLFEQSDLQELAKITYDQLQPLAGLKHLVLNYTPPAAPIPKIMADKEKLRQVMNNLIDNAIKYTPQGSITAQLSQEGDHIRFQVSDTGVGIKPGLAPQLFDKYTRGENSVTHAQGLGLGLYVCKMIVDQHHGKIWAESDGEGKGARFIFTIPIHNNLKETTLVDLAKEDIK
jgi:signal transduction histidine kinase